MFTHTHADPHSGTGSGNEGPSSGGGGATGNVPPGGEEEPKSLDPFAAMGEENRRLQSKRNSSVPPSRFPLQLLSHTCNPWPIKLIRRSLGTKLCHAITWHIECPHLA